MNFHIYRFYRAKAIASGFLSFVGFALLGMILVYLSHGNYSVITFAAILFFLGPLVVVFLAKNTFMHAVSVEVTEAYLKVAEVDREDILVRWTTVADYQVEFTKSFFGSGYALKLTGHDGSKTSVILYEPAFSGRSIREDSALYRLCRSIGKYNRSAGQPINLRPNLLATRPATIILIVMGVLVLGAIGFSYLGGARTGRFNITGFSIIVLILIAGIMGRKKEGDQAYRQLLEVQNGSK
ncbi:MAG TPA: hypothetical protein VGC01_07870 [Mucilaginibacter sp.]